jgi:hypothetical protein
MGRVDVVYDLKSFVVQIQGEEEPFIVHMSADVSYASPWISFVVSGEFVLYQLTLFDDVAESYSQDDSSVRAVSCEEGAYAE